MKAARAIAALLAMLAGCTAGSAQEKPHWVAHGQNITAAKVGPAAGGFTRMKTFAGGVIDKKRDYPFATWIEAPASYDGYDVPAGHLLIEGVAFTSSLDISAPFPVVLRGVSVRPQAGSWAILMRPASAGVYVLWSEAGGLSSTVSPGDRPVDVALDLRGTPAAVYHSRFSNAVDGIHVSGPGNVRIEQSLIDGLIAVPESHNDGIQLLGAPLNVRIVKNRVVNRNRQTSCLYLLGSRLDVRSNHLTGGGWSIYAGARNNGHGGDAPGPVMLTDNVFSRDAFPKGGHFGPVAYWDQAWTANGWAGNRFDDGREIKP